MTDALTNKSNNTIDDSALQRYHDGESPRHEARAVSEELMRDASLRSSLSGYRRIDEITRRALSELADVSAPTDRAAPRWRITAVLPIAACLTLAGAIIVALVGTDVLTRGDSPADAASRHIFIEAAPTPMPSSAYRVIVSFPAVPAAHRAPAIHAAEPAGDADRIAGYLAAGRVDQALSALIALPVADHGELWGRLAAHMRSSELARSSLLLLPVDQQVEIVRVWSKEPSLRPVVFERLNELLRDPDAAPAAGALRDELAQDPATRSWVSSYAAR